MGIANSLFEDSQIDLDEIQRLEKEKKEAAQQNRGKLKFIPEFYLKDNNPTSTIVFLNEGFKVNLHKMRDFIGGKGIYPNVLCKKQNCELCQSGKKPTLSAIYGIIDLGHSYENNKGDLVVKPTFKVMIRGLKTIKVLELRKKKYGSLTGKIWEVTKSGSSYDTFYDFLLESNDVELDFDEKETVTTKDGASVEVPAIQTPAGWFEYAENPDKMNLYTKGKMKPAHDIDWNNPKHVDMFLQHYLLQTPVSDYIRFAAQPNGKGAKGKGVAEASDDDI